MMSVELQRDPAQPLAQLLRIRHHEMLTDGSVAEGGSDAGPSPHDLYDAALGACKALTAMWYAHKKGWKLQDVRTEVMRDASAERTGTYKLATNLWVQGELTDEQLKELEAAIHKCPIHKLMTVVTTEISTSVQRHV
jgi:putative redox protein